MFEAGKFPYLIPYFISAIVSVGISWYAWTRRSVSGAIFYSWVALSQALTTMAYMLEISSDVLRVKIFWDDVQWLTLFVTAISLLVFALHFIERPPQRPFRLWSYLSILPAIFVLIILTNRWHGFMRSESTLVQGDTFSALTYEFTAGYYFASIYLIILAMVSIGLLIWRYFRVSRLYRAQLATIIAGLSLPTIGGLLVTAGVMLSAQRDVSPITFAVGNIIVAWGLFRFRLFDVAPIAREVVLDTMTEVVLVLDSHGRIVDLNRAARTLLKGLGIEKRMIGRASAEVFSRWPEFVGRYSFEQEPLVDDLVATTPAGEVRHYILRVTPIRGRDDFISGRVVVLNDITAQKKMEQELLIALEGAEQADRMKSLFFASVSHELRTPLNAVINFNQFVSSGLYGAVNNQQVDALEKSTRSARHLLSLINDVLDLSKIQSGRPELLIEKHVDLLAELEEVVTTTQSLLADKPVALVTTIGDLPLATVDRRRIRQVLLNICSNAAKFTEQGKITFAAQHEDGVITFTVQDTGPGIAEKDQPLIFEPFLQLNRGGSEPEGTGLGLAISKLLVDAHGGKLWLESSPGKGSTFYFTIPVNPSENETENNPS